MIKEPFTVMFCQAFLLLNGIYRATLMQAQQGS